MKKINKEALAVYSLIVIACISKIMGFARDAVLAGVYGTTYIADVFLFTLSIPDFFFDMVNNTVMIGFIPIATTLMLSKEKSTVNQFMSGSIKWILVICVSFCTLICLFSTGVISILAPGFKDNAYLLANDLIKILVFALVFKSIASIYSAYLGIKKVFIPSAMAGIILDIFIIVAVIMSSYTNAYVLPIAVVMASIMQFLILRAFSNQNDSKFILSAPMKTKYHMKMLKTVVPALLSVSVLQISTMVNRALATSILEGGISYLNYSSKMSFFAENIVVSSICTVLYPALNEAVAKDNIKVYSEKLVNSIKETLLLLIPVSIGLFILAEPIITFLFKRGSFTENDVQITALLMQLNIIGILGIGIQTIMTRALFALKKIKIVMCLSIITLAINVTFSIIFTQIFGISGIALATGITYILGGIIYFSVIYIIVRKISLVEIGRYGIKVCICAMGMGVIVYGVESILINLTVYISLPIAVIIGIIVYFALAKIVKVI